MDLVFLTYNICTSYWIGVVFIVILCLGILGNLINVIVFSLRDMEKSFTFVLISRLSFIDMIILVVCLSEMLFELYFNADIRIFSVFLCKIDIFLVHFLLHLRNIIFMTIAIESKLN
jgi:hypothetical protein